MYQDLSTRSHRSCNICAQHFPSSWEGVGPIVKKCIFLNHSKSMWDTSAGIKMIREPRQRHRISSSLKRIFTHWQNEANNKIFNLWTMHPLAHEQIHAKKCERRSLWWYNARSANIQAPWRARRGRIHCRRDDKWSLYYDNTINRWCKSLCITNMLFQSRDFEEWKQAMHKKVKLLQINQIDLVILLSECKIIRNKWALKVKHKANSCPSYLQRAIPSRRV